MQIPPRFLRVFARYAPIALALAIAIPAVPCPAQDGTKKIVKSEADLPRFNYPMTGTATELLQSDDATFHAFAAKVEADLDSVLSD